MSSGLLLKADIARYSWHVANVPILLKKSFLADERNFSARLVRSPRGNVRVPHRLTQKRPRTFASALRSFVAVETSKNRLSLDFRSGSIFDFCNSICQKRKSTVRS